MLLFFHLILNSSTAAAGAGQWHAKLLSAARYQCRSINRIKESLENLVTVQAVVLGFFQMGVFLYLQHQWCSAVNEVFCCWVKRAFLLPSVQSNLMLIWLHWLTCNICLSNGPAQVISQLILTMYSVNRRIIYSSTWWLKIYTHFSMQMSHFWALDTLDWSHTGLVSGFIFH